MKLSPADISSIVSTLLYDDVILETDDMGDDGETKYCRAAWPEDVEDLGLATAPCGVCPVKDQCHPGGVVSPETCEYWGEYLKMVC